MLGHLARTLVPARFRPSRYIENLVRKRTNDRVYSGPFAGMRWMAQTGDETDLHIPKLLGIYERELNSLIELACRRSFSTIVDIGAAEGYYAVGMALRNPAARVVAFEMACRERSELIARAILNSVDERIEIRGKCEPGNLEEALANVERPFVICDTEGYEAVLLDPCCVPSLRRATILVELHEFVQRGISKKIYSAFSATHQITEIQQEERTITEFRFRDPYVVFLPKKYLSWAVGESRPEEMSWLWMEPEADVQRS